MSRDPRDELEPLARELEPTNEQVQALVDGSLEADREVPPHYALLKQLPEPSREQIRALKAQVVDQMDNERSSVLWPWAAAAMALAGVIAAAAWLFG